MASTHMSFDLFSSASPSPSPQNQDNNPPTPLVDPSLGADLEVHRRKTKKRQVNRGATEGAIDLSEGEFDQSKRSMHGKERRVKSPKLRLEKLTVADYDRYREDPLEATADVCKTASNLLKQYKKEEEERFVVLKKERDEALAKAKEASDALEEADGKVKSLRSSEAKMKKELKLAKEAAYHTIEELEGSVSKLEGEVVEDLKLATKAAEEAKEEAEGSVRTLTREAVMIACEPFGNALEQVQLCNPRLLIDKTIVDINHVVQGDQNVKPWAKHDGTNLVI